MMVVSVCSVALGRRVECRMPTDASERAEISEGAFRALMSIHATRRGARYWK